MSIFLGFDPGGKRKFGWAVCSSSSDIFKVLESGIADHAEDAVNQALSKVQDNTKVLGAGIDAPLFWVENGSRKADDSVREAIQRLGSPTPSGTVQQVNSLKGACLVQGVLTANLLNQKIKNITITESHPKALLYMLGIANAKTGPNDVHIGDMIKFIKFEKRDVTEHERDAALGAYSSWQACQNNINWNNLYEEEPNPITPFNYTVSYWLPIKNVQR